MRNNLLTVFSLISAFTATSVFAEACTYTDAQLAFNNGNIKRAETLMKMAANDGDKRAVAFLFQYKHSEKPLLAALEQKAISVPQN